MTKTDKPTASEKRMIRNYQQNIRRMGAKPKDVRGDHHDTKIGVLSDQEAKLRSEKGKAR